MLAVTLLEEICRQIHTGDITMKELQKIGECMEQMKRLCQAASKEGDKVEKGQLSSKVIEKALLSRMKEFELFEGHRGQLSHLCDQIPDFVQGLIVDLGYPKHF